MSRPHWSDKLVALNACAEAVAWARTQPSLRAAWAACERGDWMLWLLGKLAGPPGSDSRRALVLAACACARLALRHVPAGEERPRRAIETAERWARRRRGVTLDEVRGTAAADAAYAAAAAAYAAYAADAAAAADRQATLSKCATIVRKRYPTPPALPRRR